MLAWLQDAAKSDEGEMSEEEIRDYERSLIRGMAQVPGFTSMPLPFWPASNGATNKGEVKDAPTRRGPPFFRGLED